VGVLTAHSNTTLRPIAFDALVKLCQCLSRDELVPLLGDAGVLSARDDVRLACLKVFNRWPHHVGH